MSGSGIFECVDTQNSLDSCGGCVRFGDNQGGGGRDCSTIANVDAVHCQKGHCVVDKCRANFKVSVAGDGCVATARASPQTRIKRNRRRQA
jgi:hypothetical protein